jgi:hypothetical protein
MKNVRVYERLSAELDTLSVATFSAIILFYLLSYVSWHLSVASLLLVAPFYVLIGRVHENYTFLKDLYHLGGAWKYVFPFGLYLIIGDITRVVFINFEDYHVYIGYIARVVFVGALLLRYHPLYTELSKWKFSITSFVVGIVIFVLWVGLDGLYPVYASADVYYDLSIFNTSIFILLLAVRLIGSVIVAAFIEELFNRSFLLRYIIDADYRSVPIGTYTPLSFIIVTLFFGFAHFQWLPALITAALLNLLIYKEKHISACITAHATANLLLLVYVVTTGNWHFW